MIRMVNYNIFRWYRPGAGRFSQFDPVTIGSAPLELGIAEGMPARYRYIWQPERQNGYRYGLSNPARVTDPDGRLDLKCAENQAPAAFQKTGQYAATPSFPGGTGGLHNGPADAFRHCYWSCLMVKNCGWDTAWAAGTGHEIYANGKLLPNPFGESAMDLHNNEQGRECGGDDCKSCDHCCLQKLFSGDLQEKTGGGSYGSKYP